MKLRQILDLVDLAYEQGFELSLELDYDFDSENQSNLVADFIVKAITRTYNPAATDKEQLEEACCSLSVAAEQLKAMAQMLNMNKQSNTATRK